MKPPEPFIWFVDRSLGRKIAVDLRAAGFQVEEHSAHFADDAPDAEWLAEAGRRGWVVLTKDKAVRRNALELAAILAGDVACFPGHSEQWCCWSSRRSTRGQARHELPLPRLQEPLEGAAIPIPVRRALEAPKEEAGCGAGEVDGEERVASWHGTPSTRSYAGRPCLSLDLVRETVSRAPTAEYAHRCTGPARKSCPVSFHFTPEKTGEITYVCRMGMISGAAGDAMMAAA